MYSFMYKYALVIASILFMWIDHLLGQWVIRGLSKNPSNRHFIPARFLHTANKGDQSFPAASSEHLQSPRAGQSTGRPLSASAKRPSSGNLRRKQNTETIAAQLQTESKLAESEDRLL